MEKLSMCRICFAQDVQMHSIANTQLEDIYEKLTVKEFMTKDLRPTQACYVCYARLRNCYQLKMSCLQSEELFTQIISTNDLQPESLKKLPVLNRLKMTPVTYLNIGLKTDLVCDIENIKTEALEVLDDVEVQKECDDVQVKTECDDIQVKEEFDEDMEALIHEEIDLKPDVIKDSENNTSLNIIQMELDDDSGTNMEASIHEEIDLKPDVVKDIQHSDSEDSEDDNTLNIIQMELDKDSGTSTPVPDREDLNNADNSPATRKRKSDKIKLVPVKKRANIKLVPQKNKSKNISSNKAKARNNCKIRVVSEQIKLNQIKNCDTLNGVVKISKVNDKSVASKKIERYTCNICHRSYVEHSKLVLHKRLHAGEKPFKCDICNKSFTQKHHLKNHMYVHTGERPFKCDICEKGFTNVSTFKGHLLIHTGVKPHICVLCDMRFTQKGSLNKHMRAYCKFKN